MNVSTITWSRWTILTIVCFAIPLAFWSVSPSMAQDEGTSPYPVPTSPTPVSATPASDDEPAAAPTPTPAPSSEATLAVTYVATQYRVPADELEVVNEHDREYPEQGRSFRAFGLFHGPSERFFNVMVDPQTQTVVEDVEAIEQAEAQAVLAKYGKLDPGLHARLATLEPNARVPVVIWIAGSRKRSDAELYAALAAKYPEAREALATSGAPFDVGDLQLGHEIEKEYMRLVEEDVRAQAQPLEAHLRGQGHRVKTFLAMPAIYVTLPKAAIQALSSRRDVGAVFLAEGQQVVEVAEATRTNRAQSVWERGIRGSGVRIAILEQGRIDLDNPSHPDNYLHMGAIRPCNESSTTHKTWVASIAASYDPVFTGMAPDATLIDACTDPYTEEDTVAGLEWALGQADIVNMSAGFTYSNYLHWIDLAFDHYARMGNATITKSSGNFGGHISSPGKAWNVITVGASDEAGDSDWANDTMLPDSAWQYSSYGDREKPEVVAPGGNIAARDGSSIIGGAPGTSASAAQVAGLAALLIDRNVNLASWPTALKAIVMASALHNIADESVIVPGRDLRDGAGSINAAAADGAASTRWTSTTSGCPSSCWWAFGIDNTNLPVGGGISRYLEATKGERVRVAIAWWASAYCPNAGLCYSSRLDTDLNLAVYGPDGRAVVGASSASWDNDYELVDFTAGMTGVYRIYISKARGDEPSNSLGIAVVKDATYLPQFRNDNGWVSNVVIRNHGAEPRIIRINYFYADGRSTPANYEERYLDPNESWEIAANVTQRMPAGSAGTAIINGGEDITVEVENQKNAQTERTNYNGVLPRYSSGSSGWEQAGTSLYAPMIKQALNGRSSTIRVMNPGTASTRIYVYYYGASGWLVTQDAGLVPPAGRITIAPAAECGTLCAARITTSPRQPVIGLVEEDRDTDGLAMSTYNLFSSGVTSIVFPLVKGKYYNNNGTGLQIQNVGAVDTTVTVNFYGQDGVLRCSLMSPALAAGASTTFFNSSCPGDGFLGTAIATASQPLVGLAAETSLDNTYKKGYSSFQRGTRVAYAPLVYGAYRDASGRQWDSGIAVLNVQGSTRFLRVTYYNSSGGVYSEPPPIELPGGNMVTLTRPAGFKGSAVIRSTRDIVVVVNVTHNGGGGDTHATYNASGR